MEWSTHSMRAHRLGGDCRAVFACLTPQVNALCPTQLCLRLSASTAAAQACCATPFRDVQHHSSHKHDAPTLVGMCSTTPHTR